MWGPAIAHAGGGAHGACTASGTSLDVHVAGGGSKLFVRYKTPTLDTIRYNVSDPSLDTMDTYFPSRGLDRGGYGGSEMS